MLTGIERVLMDDFERDNLVGSCMDMIEKEICQKRLSSMHDNSYNDGDTSGFSPEDPEWEEVAEDYMKQQVKCDSIQDACLTLIPRFQTIKVDDIEVNISEELDLSKEIYIEDPKRLVAIGKIMALKQMQDEIEKSLK